MFLLSTLFLSLVAQIYGAIRIDEASKWDYPQDGIKIYKYKDTSRFNSVMENLRENTCIKWNVTLEKIIKGQGINILKSEQGPCYSLEIGANTNNVPNTIFATDNCMNNYYVMLGLVFNALGLSYEHNRDIRDYYVTVDNSSVERSFKKYLQKDEDLKYTMQAYGTAYDYGSLLHGDPFFYSSSEKKTIRAKGPFSNLHDKMIGQRNVESFNEYRLFNYLYCNGSCTEITRCYNNGYKYKKNCGICTCPYPFTGAYCGQMLSNEGYCSNRYLDATWEFKTDANFGRKTCFISITAQSNKRIEIELFYLYFSGSCGEKCSRNNNNFIEIKYEDDKSVTGLCICMYIDGTSNRKNIITIVSSGNQAYVVYKSDGHSSQVKFRYKAI